MSPFLSLYVLLLDVTYLVCFTRYFVTIYKMAAPVWVSRDMLEHIPYEALEHFLISIFLVD